MDALRVGRSLRALRIRRGQRQADVAAAARISRSQVARIERGEIDRLAFGDVVTVAAVLGADIDLRVRWHGEGLDRLLDAAHAALVNRVVKMLQRFGWEAAVKVSYSLAGERGSVDVLGWHAASRTVLVIEVKSVVPDAQAMLFAHDRKARLGVAIAVGRGWDARQVGRRLVVGEGSTARRRVAQLSSVFAVAYPERAAEVRRWLRDPVGRLAGLVFLSYGLGETPSQRATGRQRVRRAGVPAIPAK